jgi:large repetitive protein
MSTGTGLNVSKANAYAVLVPKPGLNVSKAHAYAVLTSSNVNAPVWPAFTFGNGVVGIAYSQSFDLAPAAPATTYTTVSGSLPTGLSLSNISADIGRISGTPTVAGTFTFTLRATNAYGTADQAFSITIVSAAVVFVVDAVLPPGVIGTAYSQTLTGEGGSGPYTFAVTSGALPGGLSLNSSTGVISGTPTTAATFSFTVTATDSLSVAGAQAFTIVVSAPSGGGGGSFTFAG